MVWIKKAGLHTIIAILFASISSGIVYFFLSQYGGEETIQWFVNNIYYSIYIFLSIIIGYLTFVSNNKFSQSFILLILISHIIIGGWMVLGSNYNLSNSEFIIFIALILISFLLTQFNSKWVKSLASILIIITIGILLIGVLPLYSKDPNLGNFYSKQGIEVIIKANDNLGIIKKAEPFVSVKIGGGMAKKVEIESNGTQNLRFGTGDIIKISFASKLDLKNTYLFVLLPKGDIVSIPSQSQKEIIYSGGNYIYNSSDNLSQDWINEQNRVFTKFKKDKKEYLINRAGGELTQNITIDKMIQTILNGLYIIYPSKYGQNITNYNEYQSLLGNEESILIADQEKQDDIKSNIWNKTLKGFEGTKIKQRWNDLDSLNSKSDTPER